jgi:hypothetical protein
MGGRAAPAHNDAMDLALAPTATLSTELPAYTHEWIGQFAAHLMATDDRVPLGYAVECAVQSYHEAAEAEPELAADCFALTHFPDNVATAW